MADYEKEYIKLIYKMSELIRDFEKVRNNAAEFVIKTHDEEGTHRKKGPTVYNTDIRKK